ncbi:MAG TPA: hypothetical protein VI874_00530, partial [Candidatus Norongarragalinales archaeon]|nr:hypothetical protein [Candidatus Norongarragalinales archaeon]
SADGAPPGDVITRLTSMGFNPVTGAYDFEYAWRKKPSLDELFSFIDQVQKTLQGTGAFFKVETV